MTIQDKVLALLADGKPRTSREIAAEIDWPRPSVGAVVSQLAKGGLLRFTEHTDQDGFWRYRWHIPVTREDVARPPAASDGN